MFPLRILLYILIFLVLLVVLIRLYWLKTHKLASKVTETRKELLCKGTSCGFDKCSFARVNLIYPKMYKPGDRLMAKNCYIVICISGDIDNIEFFKVKRNVFTKSNSNWEVYGDEMTSNNLKNQLSEKIKFKCGELFPEIKLPKKPTEGKIQLIGIISKYGQPKKVFDVYYGWSTGKFEPVDCGLFGC
jgi:hypothetical protein